MTEASRYADPFTVICVLTTNYTDNGGLHYIHHKPWAYLGLREDSVR